MQPQQNPDWNALDWINNHLISHTALEPQHIQNILYFALLWNLFEDKVCRQQANVNTFKLEIQRLSSLNKLHQLEINTHLKYFRDRYISNGQINPIFDKLSFRPSDRKNLVKSVLLGTNTDFSDQVLSLLIIVYRLRNNLFHGLKEVWGLYGQEENFSHANQLLAKIIDLHQNHI